MKSKPGKSEFEEELLQELRLLRVVIAELIAPLIGVAVKDPCDGCGHPRSGHRHFNRQCSMCDCEEWSG